MKKYKLNIYVGPIILHIPHSAIKIPSYDGYEADETVLKEEQLLLTDWYTDDLFRQPDTIPILADFSRIFCDVERFEDDKDEIMSKAGMGALYERRDNGEYLRTMTIDLRSRIIHDYYKPHHQKLNDAVENQLKQYGRAFILDCHSFPDVPFNRDLNQDPQRPDYNLGFDELHTSRELLKVAYRFFIDRGHSVGLNSPYSGTIVPLNYYRKKRQVQSIMLEINRKLYLKDNSNEKSLNYQHVKETVAQFITRLNDFRGY